MSLLSSAQVKKAAEKKFAAHRCLVKVVDYNSRVSIMLKLKDGTRHDLKPFNSSFQFTELTLEAYLDPFLKRVIELNKKIL